MTEDNGGASGGAWRSSENDCQDNEDRKLFEMSLEEVVGEMGNDEKRRKQWGG